jgi:hypothetical protein
MIGLVVALVSVSFTFPVPLVPAGEIPLIVARLQEKVAPVVALVAV